MTERPDDTLSCREAELSLGALVLGALDADERLQVEAHVAGCPRCRDILAELAPLPGLLNRLEPEQAEAGLPRPPDRLLEVAMERAASRPTSSPSRPRPTTSRTAPGQPGPGRDDRTGDGRPRRRWWVAAAMAAAAVVLASVAVLATRGDGGEPPVAVPTGTSTGPLTDTVLWDGASSDGAIRAAVVLTPQTSGSRLSMTLTGVQPAQSCDLVIESVDGRREVTASWKATYEGAATITGSTSAWPQQISRMLVATPQGDTLLRLWPAK
jgi:hypothetical protein